MAGKKSTIIKGETTSGIKFAIDSRVANDARFSYYLVQLQNAALPPLEQSKLLFNLLELVFGSGDGLQTFLNEVAAHHDGVADVKNTLKETTEIFEALKVKNSSTSPS